MAKAVSLSQIKLLKDIFCMCNLLGRSQTPAKSAYVFNGMQSSVFFYLHNFAHFSSFYNKGDPWNKFMHVQFCLSYASVLNTPTHLHLHSSLFYNETLNYMV